MSASTEQEELVNPFLAARLELGYTQFDVAEEVGVSRNFIVRTESGEYPHPSQNLLEYYAGGDNSKADLLKDQYAAYRVTSRERAYGLLYPGFETPDDFLVPGAANLMHPLLYWNNRTVQITPELVPTYPLATSLYALCRAFCVHHAVMHNWTTGNQKSVPKVFLEALFESGYSESCLIGLEGAYRLYLRAGGVNV